MKKVIFILATIMFFFGFSEAKALEVNTFEELRDAINNSESEIVINSDLEFNSLLTINDDITIEGNNHKLTRASGFLNSLFSITSGKTLSISNLTIDGGADDWYLDYDNQYNTKSDGTGYVRVPVVNGDDPIATATLIANAGSLVLNNSTIQNARCTVSGCAIRGAGNNTITDSLITHIGSSTSAGAIYANGGETRISNSIFSLNAGGCNPSGSGLAAGAVYINGGSLLDISNNTIFEDNFAQSNGGAIYNTKTNLSVKDTIFRHNIVGNDGAAANLYANTAGYSLKFEDVIFEKNIGLARESQSMGTIWLQQWVSTEEDPLVFKNIIFRENDVRSGCGLADNASANTHVYFENVEFYNNKYNLGGVLYMQAAQYHLKNILVHDNNIDESEYPSGAGAILLARSDNKIVIEDSEVYDNSGYGSGIGVYVLAGDVTLKNVEIHDNETKANRGGGIYVRGTYTGSDPELTVIGSTITNNKAVTTGGGISVMDLAEIFSKITIDDSSKIYDNKADISGDDFSYERSEDDELNTAGITLDNISISGIIGIDGWYNDNEGDRYIETENPTVFNDYVEFNGSRIYLKAGGLNDLDYDLVDGENDSIVPVVIRYGVPFVVTNEEPKKDGYKFINWNTKPDGSGITLNHGDTYDGSDGFILYAIYEKIPDEGGSVVPSPDTGGKEKVPSPETSDGITKYIVMLIISALLIIGNCFLYRKYNVKKRI